MVDTLTPLILDFLEWLTEAPRSYADAMDSWRTSCPRLTVWEDAVDRGFVVRRHIAGQPLRVEVTPAGRHFLESCGRVGATLRPATTPGQHP